MIHVNFACQDAGTDDDWDRELPEVPVVGDVVILRHTSQAPAPYRVIDRTWLTETNSPQVMVTVRPEHR